MHTILKTAEGRMQKCIESFKAAIAKLRTGRAHPSLLDYIHVSYYGSDMPIHQVANIIVTDSRTLTIQPWEKSMISPIEKAIQNAGLGLNPTTAGELIRIPLPALNEERRKELIKVVRTEAEAARVSIRNVRRDAMTEFKGLLKKKLLTEDEERKQGELAQKLTDKNIAEVDQLLSIKETELMSL